MAGGTLLNWLKSAPPNYNVFHIGFQSISSNLERQCKMFRGPRQPRKPPEPAYAAVYLAHSAATPSSCTLLNHCNHVHSRSYQSPIMAVGTLSAYAAALGVAYLLYRLFETLRFHAKYRYPNILPGSLPVVGHMLSMPKVSPGELRVWFGEQATEHGEA